jgi:glycosyltransferase involved in cell wall biosynthesis
MSTPSDDSPPLVSILMPVFNARDYVEEAIASIWSQTHRPLELIVVDDGSSDGSYEIVARLAEQSPIPMHFWRQDNAGPAAALHNALQRASGEWLCWLAADDAYAPEFVERNLAAARAAPDEDLVLHSSAYLIEADGKKIGIIDEISPEPPFSGRCFDFIAEGHGRMFPSTMFTRRSFLIAAGGFDPEMEVEDTDLFLRLGRTATFQYIDEPIFYSRYTPGSFGKKPWLWGRSIIKALSKHGDLLGDRLPLLLSKASANVASNCLEYGETRHALRWAAKSVGFAPGVGRKINTAGQLGYRLARAAVRGTAYALIGRERLVRLKHRFSSS